MKRMNLVGQVSERSYSNDVRVSIGDLFMRRRLTCLLVNFQRYDPKTGAQGSFNNIDPGYCIDRIEPEELRPNAQEPWPKDMPFIGG